MAECVTLGPCTLYHGDAREVLPALADKSVDMIFTDPPYGHKNNDGDLIHNRERAIPARRKRGDTGADEYEARPIANDGVEANALYRFMLEQSPRLLAKGGCCCCCGGGPDPQFARWALWMNEALEFKQQVIWDKGPMGMGWHYRRSVECVLVGMKPGGPCT